MKFVETQLGTRIDSNDGRILGMIKNDEVVIGVLTFAEGDLLSIVNRIRKERIEDSEPSN